MGVGCLVRFFFRLMEYIENTKVDIYPNSTQKPTDEWSRLQDQEV